jgi:hypothetical protein
VLHKATQSPGEFTLKLTQKISAEAMSKQHKSRLGLFSCKARQAIEVGKTQMGFSPQTHQKTLAMRIRKTQAHSM